MAFLEIVKGHYISRIWFLYGKGQNFDVLMTLGRQLPDGDWKLKYRFRYHRDNETFGSEDEKSFTTATFPQKMTEAEAIRKVSPVLQKLKVMSRLDVDVTVIESDEPLVFVEKTRGKPYFHMKADTPHEA